MAILQQNKSFRVVEYGLACATVATGGGGLPEFD